MRLLQKIHDRLAGGPDGAPPLRPLSRRHTPPTPIRTRMGTPLDLALVLDDRAAAKLAGRHWRDSLPSLLCVMGIDDSADERARLARDLNLDLSGLAEPRAADALHAALIQRLAQTGVAAPQDFYK